MWGRPQRAGRMVLGLLGLIVVITTATAQVTGPPPLAPTSPGEPPLARPGPPGRVGPPVRPGPMAPPLAPGVNNLADPPAPQVTIRVRVPAVAHPNQELQYRFLVQNVSSAPAHQVRVRAPIPSHSKLIRATPEPEPNEEGGQKIWKLGTLKGGDSKEIIVVVKPDGSDDPECCARVQFEHGECVKTKLTQPDLRVRLTGPTQVLLHDLPRYKIEVTNAGQREAANVEVTNILPEGLVFMNSTPSTSGKTNVLDWKLDHIPPGVTKTIEYEVQVEKIGTLFNKAEVKDGAGRKAESSLNIQSGEPKLDLKVTGHHKRLFGRPARYQIEVSNPGTAPTTNLEVWSTLPVSIKFNSATAGGWLNGNEVRWKLGTLAPGVTKTLEVVLEPHEPGTFDFWANVTADRIALQKKTIQTKFEGASNLAAEIDKKPDPLQVGKVGEYTLRLVTQGPGGAEKVKATLTVPPELQIQEVKGATVQAHQEGNKVVVETEKLPPNGDATVTVKAKAIHPGNVRLHVEVTAVEPKTASLVVEESVTLYGEAQPPPAPKGP